MVPDATTKLTLKYAPEMLNESVSDHAWIARKTVYVIVEVSVTADQISDFVALPLSKEARFVGGSNTPFHVPEAVVIVTPLMLNVKVLFAESVETRFNVPVLVKTIPVVVAHHISTDHVTVVVPVKLLAFTVFGIVNESIEDCIPVYPLFIPYTLK
ncbi:TPA: hypothetical protein DCZ39_06030 [Patescibacteria group bacterium]|nr:hypothetical protein [Candidatus Gracilibacteria bacterium]